MRSPDPLPKSRPVRRRDRIERGSLLTAIVIAHLLALFWLATRPPVTRLHGDPGLVLISLSAGKTEAAAPAALKTPPPTALPTPVIIFPSLRPIPTEERTPSPSGSGAPQSGDPGGCALAALTATAITQDPAAMAELQALPPTLRTPADAVMLWNGEWLATLPGSIDSPATPSLRHLVEQIVTEASSECRGAPMVGPQFLAIPEPGRTTTLVIGSGTWRWSDLLAASDTCLAITSGSCLPQLPTP